MFLGVYAVDEASYKREPKLAVIESIKAGGKEGQWTNCTFLAKNHFELSDIRHSSL